MKKRLVWILCAVLLCLNLSAPLLAQGDMPLLVDEADLLTENEEKDLLSKLEKISKEKRMDIVVLTEDSLLGSTPAAYADDFYDYNGYAEDGILLLVSMEERDWYVSTKGYGITAVTDAGLEYMADQFLEDLSDGYYYDAFTTYAELCDEFIEQAQTGSPYDVGNLPKEPFHFLGSALISLGIGFVVALIVTGVMRSQLKSVHRRSEATEYVKRGSMKVTQSRDLFLYRQISRQKRAEESRSGGSSTHTSSSGATHGGGGGKF